MLFALNEFSWLELIHLNTDGVARNRDPVLPLENHNTGDAACNIGNCRYGHRNEYSVLIRDRPGERIADRMKVADGVIVTLIANYPGFIGAGQEEIAGQQT